MWVHVLVVVVRDRDTCVALASLPRYDNVLGEALSGDSTAVARGAAVDA
jgi:hypothetical protein